MVAKVKCTHDTKPCQICDDIRKERRRQSCLKWRANNPNIIKLLSKTYHRDNCTKPRFRYNKFKQDAKSRDLEFSISLEQYSKLIKPPCFYCRGAFGQVTKGTGLDRIDSNIGYVIWNVVSCCTTCNRIKNDTFTVEETLVAVKAILNYRSKRGLEEAQAQDQTQF